MRSENQQLSQQNKPFTTNSNNNTLMKMLTIYQKQYLTTRLRLENGQAWLTIYNTTICWMLFHLCKRHKHASKTTKNSSTLMIAADCHCRASASKQCINFLTKSYRLFTHSIQLETVYANCFENKYLVVSVLYFTGNIP